MFFGAVRNLLETECKRWREEMVRRMQAAGVYIRGNVFHRFRDTAVDWWLENGLSMTEVAAMLGDTVAVCETHYADLASNIASSAGVSSHRQDVFSYWRVGFTARGAGTLRFRAAA